MKLLLLAGAFYYMTVPGGIETWKEYGPFNDRVACLEDIRSYADVFATSECYQR